MRVAGSCDATSAGAQGIVSIDKWLSSARRVSQRRLPIRAVRCAPFLGKDNGFAACQLRACVASSLGTMQRLRAGGVIHGFHSQAHRRNHPCGSAARCRPQRVDDRFRRHGRGSATPEDPSHGSASDVDHRAGENHESRASNDSRDSASPSSGWVHRGRSRSLELEGFSRFPHARRTQAPRDSPSRRAALGGGAGPRVR